MIALSGTPFGAAIGGLVAQATSVRVALVVAGGGVVTSSVLAWFSPLRSTRDVAVSPDAEPGYPNPPG
jgi:hypothetical protein